MFSTTMHKIYCFIYEQSTSRYQRLVMIVNSSKKNKMHFIAICQALISSIKGNISKILFCTSWFSISSKAIFMHPFSSTSIVNLGSCIGSQKNNYTFFVHLPFQEEFSCIVQTSLTILSNILLYIISLFLRASKLYRFSFDNSYDEILPLNKHYLFHLAINDSSSFNHQISLILMLKPFCIA